MDSNTLLVNNLAATAQRAPAGERGKAVHALCDALLGSPAHILTSYLPLVLESARAADSASRQTLCIFLGLLLSRDVFRVVAHIDVLVDRLSDSSADVVEAAARALSGLFRPTFQLLAQQTSQESFHAWDTVHGCCRHALIPFMRPHLHHRARCALTDLLIQAAAVCVPPFSPPSGGPSDEQLAGCNAISLSSIPALASSGLLVPDVALAAAERLVCVDIASLMRDCTEARAAVQAEDYAYVMHRLVRLAIWRPVLVDACLRSVAVFFTIPAAHICLSTPAGLVLRPELQMSVRTCLSEAVSFVQLPTAAQAFGSLTNVLSMLPSSASGVPSLRCPATKPLILNPDVVTALAPAELAEVVMVNLLNPPAADVMRAPLPPSAAAALEGLLASMQIAEEAAEKLKADQAEQAAAAAQAAEAEADAKAKLQEKGGPLVRANLLASAWMKRDALGIDPAVTAAALNRLMSNVAHALGTGKGSSGGGRQKALIMGTEGQRAADNVLAASSLLIPVAIAGGDSHVPTGAATVTKLLQALSTKDVAERSSVQRLANLLAVVIHRVFHTLPEDASEAACLGLEGLIEFAQKGQSLVADAEYMEAVVDAVARYLLDCPCVDWARVTSRLLMIVGPSADPDIIPGVPDEASSAAVRMGVRVLDLVLPLRPQGRLLVLEGMLSLMVSKEVEIDVFALVQEVVGGRLSTLDESSKQHASSIALAALDASTRFEGRDPEAKRRRSEEKGDSSVFSSVMTDKLPSCKTAALLLLQPIVSQSQSASLLRLFLGVAEGIPSLLLKILKWSVQVAEIHGSAIADQIAALLSSVTKISAREGLVPTLRHIVGSDEIQGASLPIMRRICEALCDAGITAFQASVKRQQETAADTAEVEGTDASTAAHPQLDAGLQELIVEIRMLRIGCTEGTKDESQIENKAAAVLVAPLIAVLSLAVLPTSLRDVFSVARLGDVRYTVQRLLHTTGCPPVAPPDHMFSIIVTAADSIAARTDIGPAERIRLLTEASAGLLDDRAVFTDKIMQASLQRVIVEAVEAHRKAPAAYGILPVLAMRCFAVVARAHPELRSVLVEQMLGLLRAVGGTAFEALSAISGWPNEEFVAAGPRWDGFTRFLKLTIPISFSLLPLLPEALARLLLTPPSEAELKRRASKWCSLLRSQDGIPVHLALLLGPDSSATATIVA